MVDTALQSAAVGRKKSRHHVSLMFPAWQGRSYCITVTATAAVADAAAAVDRNGVGEDAAARAPAAAQGAAAAAAAPAVTAARVPAAAPVMCRLKVGIGHSRCLPKGALGTALYRLQVPVVARVHTDPEDLQLSGVDSGWRLARLGGFTPGYIPDFFEIGQFRSYLECERKLRHRRLVGADDCMMLTVRLKGVLH